MMYIGRFAPSPTGPLHFGSLITATGSYLEARSQGGQWLLRIENIDPPREMPGATDLILHTLEAFGFEWDGPVIYQSQRIKHYKTALNQLAKQGVSYPCRCNRKQRSESNSIYPGTCRHAGLDPGNEPCAIRVITHNDSITFTDLLQGDYTQRLQSEVGDFQILRRDGFYAYHLAVVVDDATQRITDIVRGSDLLDSTPRQIFLQKRLGYPTPRYLHLPIAVNTEGQKLSKQNFAEPIHSRQASLWLWHALAFLDQQPPFELVSETPGNIWSWAFKHWKREHIHRCLSKACPEIKPPL